MKETERKMAAVQDKVDDKALRDIRVAIIDGNELIRYGLRRMLEQEEGLEMVADYSNAGEALPQLAKLAPDVILMDAHTPGMNGIEATHHLKRNGWKCDAEIIVLADTEAHRGEALLAGAAAFLLKNVTRTELLQTIGEVYQRRQWPQEYEDLVERAVELVVPPSSDAGQLMRFMFGLEKGLNRGHEYSCVSVARTVGSWEWGTVITVLVRRPLADNLRQQLETMPGVAGVEEEAVSGAVSIDFPRKSALSVRSGIAPSRRFCVNLGEARVPVVQN